MLTIKEPFYISVLYQDKEYKLLIKQQYCLNLSTYDMQGYLIKARNVQFNLTLLVKNDVWRWTTLNEVKHWHLWNTIIVQLEASLKEIFSQQEA